MFTASNQNNVCCTLNNWCICINISCGPEEGALQTWVRSEILGDQLLRVYEGPNKLGRAAAVFLQPPFLGTPIGPV